jgi:MarR family transcriptional regulator, organic hydroperoxide resistance regulator
VSGPGEMMFAFVRYWSRRPWTDGSDAEQGRLVLVTEGVHVLTGRGIPATINAVAQEVGIDQSGASRLVKQATSAGHLTMRPSGSDGRVRLATVTPSGRVMLDRAHAWQEQTFDRLTQGWGEQRRQEFRQAMTDLVERSGAVSPDEIDVVGLRP